MPLQLNAPFCINVVHQLWAIIIKYGVLDSMHFSSLFHFALVYLTGFMQVPNMCSSAHKKGRMKEKEDEVEEDEKKRATFVCGNSNARINTKTGCCYVSICAQK